MVCIDNPWNGDIIWGKKYKEPENKINKSNFN